MAGKTVRFEPTEIDARTLEECHTHLWKKASDDIAVVEIAERIFTSSPIESERARLSRICESLHFSVTEKEMEEFIAMHWKVLPELHEFADAIIELRSTPTKGKLERAILLLHCPQKRISNTTGPSLMNYPLIRKTAQRFFVSAFTHEAVREYRTTIEEELQTLTPLTLSSIREVLAETIEFIPLYEFFIRSYREYYKKPLSTREATILRLLQSILSSRILAKTMRNYGKIYPKVNVVLAHLTYWIMADALTRELLPRQIQFIADKTRGSDDPVEKALFTLMNREPLAETRGVFPDTLLTLIEQYNLLQAAITDDSSSDSLMDTLELVAYTRVLSPPIHHLLNHRLSLNYQSFLWYLTLFPSHAVNPQKLIDECLSFHSDIPSIASAARDLQIELEKETPCSIELQKRVADAKAAVFCSFRELSKEDRTRYFRCALPFGSRVVANRSTAEGFRYFLAYFRRPEDGCIHLENFLGTTDEDRSLFTHHLYILLNRAVNRSEGSFASPHSLSIVLRNVDLSNPLFHRTLARFLSVQTFTDVAPFVLQLLPLRSETFLEFPFETLFGPPSIPSEEEGEESAFPPELERAVLALKENIEEAPEHLKEHTLTSLLTELLAVTPREFKERFFFERIEKNRETTFSHRFFIAYTQIQEILQEEPVPFSDMLFPFARACSYFEKDLSNSYPYATRYLAFTLFHIFSGKIEELEGFDKEMAQILFADIIKAVETGTISTKTMDSTKKSISMLTNTFRDISDTCFISEIQLHTLVSQSQAGSIESLHLLDYILQSHADWRATRIARSFKGTSEISLARAYIFNETLSVCDPGKSEALSFALRGNSMLLQDLIEPKFTLDERICISEAIKRRSTEISDSENERVTRHMDLFGIRSDEDVIDYTSPLLVLPLLSLDLERYRFSYSEQLSFYIRKIQELPRTADERLLIGLHNTLLNFIVEMPKMEQKHILLILGFLETSDISLSIDEMMEALRSSPLSPRAQEAFSTYSILPFYYQREGQNASGIVHRIGISRCVDPFIALNVLSLSNVEEETKRAHREQLIQANGFLPPVLQRELVTLALRQSRIDKETIEGSVFEHLLDTCPNFINDAALRLHAKRICSLHS